MNEKLYEIHLIDVISKKQIKVYEWSYIPNVGDYLSLEENEIFVVANRLLPTSKDSYIVNLVGSIQ